MVIIVVAIGLLFAVVGRMDVSLNYEMIVNFILEHETNRLGFRFFFIREKKSHLYFCFRYLHFYLNYCEIVFLIK